MKSFVNLEDGSNLTEISPLLTCIHTLNQSDTLWDTNNSKYFKSLSLKELQDDKQVSKDDGFSFAVSLRDGSCLYTSNAITEHLGYPQDMLQGQCIMNFLFHKDHITFANHLTQGLNACFIQGKRDDSHLVLNVFFCRIRMYHGLKFGYSISDKDTQYKPFKITLHINELIVDDMCVEKPSGTLCVKATATQVTSGYSVPEEIPAMTSFSSRHTASCHFSHVDASAIPYLGYLPQDMIGYSVFDFYHIDDLPQLKDIYELVVKEHGSFRSKPYRFRVQNGCYILLETEWSCFINPWSHKLEFVVGQHRVLKGPTEIDIFTPSLKLDEPALSEEIVKESIVIQKEIKALLSQTIQAVEAKKHKRFCTKRKRDLAAFVYNCIDESLKANKHKTNAEKQDFMDDKSNSDPDSVVMGDISPYREVNDSSVSSETPPTVQHLRYQENIERFFASQPKTYSDESDESNKNDKLSSVDDSQGSSSAFGNGSGGDASGGSKGTSKEQDSSQSASFDRTSSSNNNNNNPQSGSNSSKCNLSTFTTGDSGYGKSTTTDKNTTHHNDPCTSSQAGSSTQMWTKGGGATTSAEQHHNDKFSSCLALTEESLTVHNRMNNKHTKQQRKSKVNTIKDTGNWYQQQQKEDNANWYQQKEAKQAKNPQILPKPTQKEDAAAKMANEKANVEERQGRQNATEQQSIPNITNPFLFPHGSCMPTPTPFYIPVMYMGSMPFFPSQSSNGVPNWPFGPTTAFAPNQPTQFQQPCSMQQNDNLQQQHQSPFPSYGKEGNHERKKSTKMQVASVSSTPTPPSFKRSFTKNKLAEKDKHKNVPNKSDSSDMQVEESQSSYTRSSSSFQSGSKYEDMDFEVKNKPYPRPPSGDKIHLSSDIAYRYQLSSPTVEEVLKRDMEALRVMTQPQLVNEQLQMLREEQRSEAKTQAAVKSEENDRNMEDVMLGMTQEQDLNEELEYHEECLMQLMCEDS